MSRQTTLLVVGVLLGAVLGVGAAVTAIGPAAPGVGPTVGPDGPNTTLDGDASVEQFGSQSAFAEYVREGQRRAGTRHVVLSAQSGGDGGDAGGAVEAEQPTADSESATVEAPDRIGETNVQVAGLDEPDLVKTDGRHFFYAPSSGPRTVVVEEDGEPKKVRREGQGHVIDASQPANPAALAEIDHGGQMLQTGDRLLVLQHDRILGYDVSNASNPQVVWEKSLDASLVTARERNGTVYLVTESHVGSDPVCPLTPLGASTPVDCGAVYHPSGQIPVDATYSAFAIDADDGEVRDSASFVGTTRNTVVYMSHDALYVTYTESVSRADRRAEFFLEHFDRTPQSLADRIEEIRSYDISTASQSREIERAVRSWLASLDEDERAEVRAELADRYDAYLADRQRALQRTGIVRVDVEGTDLTVATTGTVPGQPLNQFSLDQHDGSLRVATTIPAAGSASSVNDLYTLDAASLERQGAVTGMGEDQRVYAVRYVEDTAYVVTFRRVDPLHVVDLSDPASPEEVGTLKLPGFSNYLHPIDQDHVLGIGEQDGTVKAVLFDVSDPTDPVVQDSRIFDARWSAVSESHHAFTIDRRHEVFFLPAGEAGHVVSYADGSLELTTSVAMDHRTTRARYVENSLYVFAGSQVAVIDETTWNRTATLDLLD
ncbi:beta-propeller domain-containing protein [Halobacteriales archaeon Cl-PHB]